MVKKQKEKEYNSTLMEDSLLECLSLNSKLALPMKQWLLWNHSSFPDLFLGPTFLLTFQLQSLWELTMTIRKSIILGFWYLKCFLIVLPNKLFRQRSFSALASGARHLLGRAGSAAAN